MQRIFPLMQRIGKFLKDWGITLLLVVILLVPSWRLTLASLAQSAVLKTGLFKPQTEATGVALAAADYQVTLEAANGQLLSLHDWQGQTLFLNFWATWCAPCLAEMPDLEALYQKLKQQPNLRFAFISTDQDWEKAKAFMVKKGYEMPLYRVLHGSALFNVTTLPTTLVINNAGELVVNRQGMAQYHNQEFMKFLRAQAALE